MKLTLVTTIILFFGLTFSCSTSHDKKVDDHPAETHQETPELTLSLNNGAKWKSDESTFTGMKRLELTLFNFSKDFKEPTINDYNKLGEALANINADIIKQCSMEGKDHDQLHILLAPMLENVDVIKKGTDPVQVEENVQELRSAITKFFAHFEVK